MDYNDESGEVSTEDYDAINELLSPDEKWHVMAVKWYMCSNCDAESMFAAESIKDRHRDGFYSECPFCHGTAFHAPTNAPGWSNAMRKAARDGVT